jgi:hypothetical protein
MFTAHPGCLAAALALIVIDARAPAHAGVMHEQRCDRIATTAITFGYTGGTLKPSGLRIAADGTVKPIGVGAGMTHSAESVPRNAVRRMARLGWTGPFVSLPTAPTRPTRNPDAARQYIELRSACGGRGGTKHVEYADGEGAPAFRDLYARLQALAGVQATAPR